MLWFPHDVFRRRKLKLIGGIRIRTLSVLKTGVVCVFLIILFNAFNFEFRVQLRCFEQEADSVHAMHNYVVNQFYNRRKFWRLSALGNVLYKNEPYPTLSEEKKNKIYVILIWKHWNHLKQRHVYYFGNVTHDPLSECSVKNCAFTGDNASLPSADAVIIHLHRGDIPPSEQRSPTQRWIFLNDEAPPNAFPAAKNKSAVAFSHNVAKRLHNVFNWSMTYVSDSDVPVPYGRTVALDTPMFLYHNPPIQQLVPHWHHKRRDVLVGMLISYCNIPYRKQLIPKINELIPINIHGKCGTKELNNSCPGHFRADCYPMSQYLFYLVLENSKCREYMTEKIFHNAYSKGAIPIIQGPPVQDCESFLPPNSYLHLDKYASLKDLADDIVRISRDDKELLYYHEWRNHFRVVNEHGYFTTKSVHLCRVCEAMNYNQDVHSVYSEQKLKMFLDTSSLCRRSAHQLRNAKSPGKDANNSISK